MPLPILLLWLVSCQKDADIDQEVPEILLEAGGTFPLQCTDLQRGESYEFQFTFRDQVALGSYSLDIHHNFDQHTHSTELLSCAYDPKKVPVQPFVFIRDYSIPAGAKDFTARVSLTIPSDVDPGDYHLMVKLTDQAGWSTMKGLSIKIK